MLKDFLTIREAAAEIGVACETLRLWRSLNRGPESYMIGGRLYWSRAGIEEWTRRQMAASVRGGITV